MEVDRAYIQLTKQDKKKYLSEGRCFHCGEKAHMACHCPTNQKPLTYTRDTQARETKVELPPQEDPQKPNEYRKGMKARFAKMSHEERQLFFDEVMVDPDF